MGDYINTEPSTDSISRQAAIDKFEPWLKVKGYSEGELNMLKAVLYELRFLPSAQPEFTEQDVRDAFNDGYSCGMESVQSKFEERTAELAQNVPNGELIPKKAVIEVIDAVFPVDPMKSEYAQGITCGAALAKTYVEQLPSAQPERTCVNCGRTANNGGWYVDGRTRCPIEEHYALPKDGYCHLWEKRNVTDDDYPERWEE